MAEKLFGGGGEFGALLRTYHWSQTPLGAVETWSDDLKTAVQVLLTELEQAQYWSQTQVETETQPPLNLHLAAAIEPTCAEVKLRELEAQYRTLFDSIDEGFCICEMLFDENDEPDDYRFLKVNAAFERLTGLEQVTGKRMRELAPNHEAYWFEIYGRVVRTREAVRLENYASALNRWFNVNAFCIGEPQNNQFAVLFTNVTDAKRVEDERFEAEVTLRQSEEHYRTLFESIDEGFCTVEVLFDADGKPIDHRVLQANPAFKRQSGIANPEGKRASELAPGLEQDWNDLYAQVINTGESIRTEVRADALDRWFDVLVSRVGNAAMRQVAIVFTDISKRKQAEAILQQTSDELERQVRKFDATLSTITDLVFSFDRDGRFLYANQVLLDLWGVTAPEAIGKTMADLNYPPTVERQVLDDLQQVLETGKSVRNETPYINPAGVEGYFEYILSPVIAADHTVESTVGLSRDISDRKLADAIITTDLKNTRLLRDLSARMITEDNIQVLYDEIMAAAIALTRADAGTVQLLDEATQELVLLASKGFDQTIIDHFERVNASSNTSCGLALLRGTRAFIDFDMPECNDPCGALRMHVNAGYLCAQSTPLLSRSGRPMGMVSTHWHQYHRPTEQELGFLDLLARQAADLIEQRQTQAERKQILEREQAAREEAERANRIKDEFLAVLSHELRSPLNPILGWTQLLQNGKLDEAHRAEALKTIERNAKLQAQLIEDLLDISRIMQGKLSLTAAPVSLTFVISAAIETVRLAAEAKHIRLQIDLDNTAAPISGDAARLQQVVWNLLSNAVKFTPNGGQVTVELRQLNQLAQIRVIDTGKGINPQFLPYMFEYFRQEDGSTTRKFGGLGLGLAIARQIVEMHGGTVRAESFGEGQGATFIVQLPAMEQTASIGSEPVQTQTGAELPLKGIHILLIDDEPDTREFQAFVLEQSGAKVTAVASGLEALQALEQSIPNVLVSDIGMAQMDGYMLIEQIRSRPLQHGGMIPAIALTAYAAEMDQHRALQVGFQTHITKPVEPEVLVRAITVLLQPGERKVKMRL
ncbi:MAG: PAS domain S-box protein [Nostoc indistinguendum CM1-VF10]|jgi:PAS domain S-box-containing protein|nr:PAS domain S-box protein [Nostoc indistinguendum CM1-VF10]